jgi:hypothetical protein
MTSNEVNGEQWIVSSEGRTGAAYFTDANA